VATARRFLIDQAIKPIVFVAVLWWHLARLLWAAGVVIAAMLFFMSFITHGQRDVVLTLAEAVPFYLFVSMLTYPAATLLMSILLFSMEFIRFAAVRKVYFGARSIRQYFRAAQAFSRRCVHRNFGE
jgi:hypothetical protein